MFKKVKGVLNGINPFSWILVGAKKVMFRLRYVLRVVEVITVRSVFLKNNYQAQI